MASKQNAYTLALLRAKGGPERESILKQWSETFVMPEGLQATTFVAIENHNRMDNLDYIVKQLEEYQLINNWQQYVHLRDEWSDFCSLLDEATSKALRCDSFRENCAIWTSAMHALASYCHHNGMLLGLPWSAVARFMSLLKVWGPMHRAVAEEPLFKTMVAQLCQMLWHNFMRCSDSGSLPNGAFEPRLDHIASLQPHKVTIPDRINDNKDPALVKLRRQEEDRAWKRIVSKFGSSVVLQDSQYQPSDPDSATHIDPREIMIHKSIKSSFYTSGPYVVS